MRPLRLKMQAFGSYGKETLIDFEKIEQNLFLITGDTGAGKTTIFDAIVFALYGEASSSSNKKEGVVLQSQYVDYEWEPFVELIFTDGDNMRYTVRRVPAHLKTITRGTSKGGQRKISGSVSLIMPDGTEYPSKETDGKLREIIGLTKGQFMQIAMIAQGEFMELLRAKSDDKKEIFRKLFNTEIYDDIVNELNNRRSKKVQELAVIKTQCQSEAARIHIPGDYADAPEIIKLKKLIENGEVSAAGDFVDQLGALCDYLNEKSKEAEAEYAKADRVRKEKLEKLNNARSILKWYEQLEAANKKIEQYCQQEDEIRQAKELAVKIRSAYEIKEKYERSQESRKRVIDTESSLKKLEGELPSFIEILSIAEREENEKRKAYDAELKRYSIVNENVEKTRKNFEKIADIRAKIQSIRASLDNVVKDRSDYELALEKLKKQEIDWKTQSEEMKDIPVLLAQKEAKYQESKNLKEEFKRLQAQRSEVDESFKKMEKNKIVYAKIKEQYQAQNDVYESQRQAFLDEQAGILAAELRDGEPCPVCGSIEHPHPMGKSDIHVDISPEKLNEYRENVEKLRLDQEKASAECSSSIAQYTTQKGIYEETFTELYEKINKNICELPEKADLDDIKKILEGFCLGIQKEVIKLKASLEKLETIQTSLQNIDRRRDDINEHLSMVWESENEIKTDLERENGILNNLNENLIYKTEKDAQDALDDVIKSEEKSEKEHNLAAKNLNKHQKQRNEAETLIAKYSNELPELSAKASADDHDYTRKMSEKNLTEEEWKELTETYHPESEKEILDRVSAFEQNKIAAMAQVDSAQKAIGDEKKPLIDESEAASNVAELRYNEIETLRNSIRHDLKDNETVYDSLRKKIDERKGVLEEHRRIDSLYRMTSGKVSGARMDLETYVQRYYLERILYAANRRFREMTAGQFELRMYDYDKAGEGKNKGLDLMVYSTVTGKEREVRTLSGGESFMAALSLALGMADQIQDSSAAISLDIMFIDEGFGSLDEHSRNQAVRVLKDMAEGSRLIGIISHVTELKQDIEDQLIVSKDENGSHVRWQIS